MATALPCPLIHSPDLHPVPNCFTNNDIILMCESVSWTALVHVQQQRLPAHADNHFINFKDTCQASFAGNVHIKTGDAALRPLPPRASGTNILPALWQEGLCISLTNELLCSESRFFYPSCSSSLSISTFYLFFSFYSFSLVSKLQC